MAAPGPTEASVEVKSRAELRDWLARNHALDGGIWLVSYKKGAGHYLPMGDIVAECLAFGWVDSRSRGLDARRTMHYISPRKPGSGWSAANKRLVARLEADGQMHAAGASAIARAKADGSWSLLDDVENLVVPPDLGKALAERPGATENWESFPRSICRGTLAWIQAAKRPDTRQRRVTSAADEAAAGIRTNR